MKSYKGGRGIPPLILNIGTRRRLVVNFTLRPFTTEKEARYPLSLRLGEPQSLAGKAACQCLNSNSRPS